MVEPHGFIAAGADDIGPGPDELNRRDLFRVAGDAPRLLARLEVPDFDLVVGPGARQQAAVGLPGDAQHMVRVPLERAHMLARGDVEDLHELVGGPARQVFAVWRELDAEDRVAMGVFEFARKSRARKRSRV